jgi:hypothetical protein
MILSIPAGGNGVEAFGEWRRFWKSGDQSLMLLRRLTIDHYG